MLKFSSITRQLLTYDIWVFYTVSIFLTWITIILAICQLVYRQLTHRLSKCTHILGQLICFSWQLAHLLEFRYKKWQKTCVKHWSSYLKSLSGHIERRLGQGRQEGGQDWHLKSWFWNLSKTLDDNTCMIYWVWKDCLGKVSQSLVED